MRCILMISVLSAIAGCSDQQQPPFKLVPIANPNLKSRHVTPGELPALTLSPPTDSTPGHERIEVWIASLSQIDSPDFGFSPTLSGSAFLPIEGKTSVGALVFTDHRIQSSDALKQLVAAGAAALPALLAHLDDTTPTRLTIHQSNMFFENELQSNPISRREQSVLQAQSWAPNSALNGNDRSTYTVKVGDICFVAIGQITGRGYQAVRYQPSMCIVINSSTDNVVLCARVRAMWESDDARQMLFDSLLQDYATKGILNDGSLDGWRLASPLQTEAAMRLLYYFPAESAGMIADRLDQLCVTQAVPSGVLPEEYSDRSPGLQRELINGVRTKPFIAATAWSQHPEIVAAVAGIADRTDDDSIRALVVPTEPAQ